MSDMKLIMESWRHYTAEQQEAIQLVEDIWNSGDSSRDLILENEIKLLEEGIVEFFRDAYASVKTKIDQFKTFSEQKLMSFVEAGLKKIDSFMTMMRKVAKDTKNDILLALFPKYGTRKKQDVLKVLMMPKYLKIGASIVAIILQKAAKLGMSKILDVITAGGSAAARVTVFLRDNVENIKLFIKSIIDALDPVGMMDIIEKFQIAKDAKELVDEFKADLQGQRFTLNED